MSERETLEKWAHALGLSSAEQYVEMLRRIKQQQSVQNLKQTRLGELMGGVKQPRVSQLLLGRKKISRSTLYRTATGLGIDVRYLMGLPVVSPDGGSQTQEQAEPSKLASIERSFTHRISHALGQDWLGIPSNIWLALVPHDEECMRKILPICSEMLIELDGLTIGSEFLEAAEGVVWTTIRLAERARAVFVGSDRRSLEAGQLLFHASYKGSHCLCYAELEEKIRPRAAPFVQGIYAVLCERPNDKALRTATYSIHGDILKIAAGADASLYPQARRLFEDCREVADGKRKRPHYQSTRSLAIVAAHDGISDTDCDEIAAKAEDELQYHKPPARAHCRDGLIEMTATRFERTGRKSKRLQEATLRHIELYKKEWALAVEECGPNPEWALRGQKAMWVAELMGIREHLPAGKNTDTDLRERGLEILRDAGKSPRVCRQVAKKLGELMG